MNKQPRFRFLLLCIVQLAWISLLNAQPHVSIQLPSDWKQVSEAKTVQSSIHMLGTYTKGSPELFAMVIVTPDAGMNYDKAKTFVQHAEHGFEAQKLDLNDSYPIQELGLPGMAVSAYGNQLFNLSLCLFAQDRVIQVNAYCKEPLSAQSPLVKEFLEGIHLSASIKAASLTQEELVSMNQMELSPDNIRKYAIFGAVALLLIALIYRMVRRGS